MKLKQINWGSIKRLASPQATQDLNRFLENLPQHTGNSVLIVAAVIWSVAGGLGLYTFVQSRSLAEFRAQLIETEAVKPNVPSITNIPETASNVQAFVDKAKDAYENLEMNAQGSAISITAEDTRYFPQFREAIGHIQNGGRGWRVNIDKICVGRECGRKPLEILLKVNKVSIETNS